MNKNNHHQINKPQSTVVEKQSRVIDRMLNGNTWHRFNVLIDNSEKEQNFQKKRSLYRKALDMYGESIRCTSLIHCV